MNNYDIDIFVKKMLSDNPYSNDDDTEGIIIPKDADILIFNIPNKDIKVSLTRPTGFKSISSFIATMQQMGIQNGNKMTQDDLLKQIFDAEDNGSKLHDKILKYIKFIKDNDNIEADFDIVFGEPKLIMSGVNLKMIFIVYYIVPLLFEMNSNNATINS